MSRSGYNDDCDYDHANLYRANVDRAMVGKRGHALLKDMLAELDAMPVKRLIYGDFVAPDGAVCALGAACRARGRLSSVAGIDPEENASYVAGRLNIAECLAREIMYMNDEGNLEDETEEGRWHRIRRWATFEIANAERLNARKQARRDDSPSPE